MNKISSFRTRSVWQAVANFAAWSILVSIMLTGQSRAQKVTVQKFDALVEMEYELISVPNRPAGKILQLSQNKLYPALQEMVRHNEASLYNIIKSVAPSRTKAVFTGYLAKAEMEPYVLPDQQIVDLNVRISIGEGTLTTSVTIPTGQTLYLGSFDNPTVDATIFVFTKWKIDGPSTQPLGAINDDEVKVEYLCQAMLVRVPTGSVKALTDSSGDLWALVTGQIASGEATLLSSPSFTTKSGQRALCEAKLATLEIEPTAKEPNQCDMVFSFKSADLKYDSQGGITFDVGRSRILASTADPNGPTKSLVLLFRVMKPVGKDYQR